MRTADKEVIDSGYRETLRQDILEWSALGFDRSRVGPGQRDKAGRRSLLKTPIVEVQSRFRNEKKNVTGLHVVVQDTHDEDT